MFSGTGMLPSEFTRFELPMATRDVLFFILIYYKQPQREYPINFFVLIKDLSPTWRVA
jgi:hypothetical protein